MRRVDSNFCILFFFSSHSRYTAVLQYKRYSNLYRLIYFYHCHTAQCNLSMYLHSILYVLLCNYLCVNKCIFYVCVQFLFGFVSVCNRAEALQTESNAYSIGLYRHRLCVILTLTSVYWDPQGTITPSNTHIHRTITAWSQGETEDNL